MTQKNMTFNCCMNQLIISLFLLLLAVYAIQCNISTYDTHNKL